MTGIINAFGAHTVLEHRSRSVKKKDCVICRLLTDRISFYKLFYGVPFVSLRADLLRDRLPFIIVL